MITKDSEKSNSITGWRIVVRENGEKDVIKASDGSATYSKYGVIEIPSDIVQEDIIPQNTSVDEEADIVINEVRTVTQTMILASELSADEITAILDLYESWQVEASYNIDDLIVYNSVLYRVVQLHTSQANWTPDVSDSLFTEAAPTGVILEWVQPTGAHDAYNTGDQVVYNSHVWESTIDANVWSPSAYPQGWNDLGEY